MRRGPFARRGEDEWVAALSGRLAPRGVPGLGIGHDCATVELGGAPAIVSTDVLVDGVHFVLAECGARRAASEAKGCLRGRGLSSYLEWTGGRVHDETVTIAVHGNGRIARIMMNAELVARTSSTWVRLASP